MIINDWSIETIATDLGFPEGPLALGNGQFLFCDIRGGLIRQMTSGGSVSVIAAVGGGPNGLARAPDGSIYVANNGGRMRWRQEGTLLLSEGFLESGFDARIERLDTCSGMAVRVLDRIDGRPFQAIDDLLHDGSEGFWFTDLGRGGDRSRTYGGVYWCSTDGARCEEAAYPLPMGANGIGMSPDGRTLYATEYGAGRLWSWEIAAPGELRHLPGEEHGGSLLWQEPRGQLLDSLKVTRSGSIVIATQRSGCFSVVSPEGSLLATIPMPEDSPTNICFPDDEPEAAYATLSNSGRLVRIGWDEDRLLEAAGSGTNKLKGSANV